MHYPRIAEIVRKDPRYAYEAYEFLFEALKHTQETLGRSPPPKTGDAPAQYHVSGRELLDGVRDLALRQFGLMSRTVFHLWGVRRTEDFGEIVFNLVEAGLMSKTSEDCREDFRDVYDLDQALVQGYQIRFDETE